MIHLLIFWKTTNQLLLKNIFIIDGYRKRKEHLEIFNLTEQKVENCLNLNQFFNIMKSMKSNNKLFCFVLLFFPKFDKENDQIISKEIKKYLKEEETSNFYNMLDKEILKKKKWRQKRRM